jgi:hypothetical protein
MNTVILQLLLMVPKRLYDTTENIMKNIGSSCTGCERFQMLAQNAGFRVMRKRRQPLCMTYAVAVENFFGILLYFLVERTDGHC